MSQIQQVKDAHNIVDIIGNRLTLQRAGSNFKGLCPFHSEKSPSFFVSEEMQRFKCFGCGENGDVYTFLEKYEGMTFTEALEMLAQEAGIQLEQFVPDKQDELRAQLLTILDLTREYYHWLLTKHAAGKPALEYLKERKTTRDSIKLFQMGYAPPQWDGLIKFLHGKKKFSLELLEQAGLVIRSRSGRVYDRFRGRVMFPLRNHRGQVVGFSGRVLPSLAEGDGETAKYINSPETLVYHKSELLFGYSELLQSIRKQSRVILVEGEFDVVSSVQAHVSHVAAIKGSALTPQHVRLLGRTVDTIVLCLDADKAGIAATQKAIEVVNAEQLSRERPLELRVLRIPGGKDPDDLARSDPKAWREAAKHSISAYDFLIEVAFEQYDARSASGKRSIMQFLAPWLAKVQHAVEREHYVQTLSNRLEVSESSIEKDLQIAARPERRKRQSSQSSAANKQRVVALSRREQLERRLWFLVLHSSGDQFLTRLEKLAEHELVTDQSQVLVKTLRTAKTQDWQAAVRGLPKDQQEAVFELYSEESVLDQDYEVTAAEWQRTLTQLKQEIRHAQVQQISEALELLEQKKELTEAEEAQQNELLRKLVSLRRA